MNNFTLPKDFLLYRFARKQPLIFQNIFFVEKLNGKLCWIENCFRMSLIHIVTFCEWTFLHKRKSFTVYDESNEYKTIKFFRMNEGKGLV